MHMMSTMIAFININMWYVYRNNIVWRYGKSIYAVFLRFGGIKGILFTS